MNTSLAGEVWGRRLARLLEEVFEDPLVGMFAELADVRVLPEYLSGVGSYCAMLGFAYGDASFYMWRSRDYVYVKVSTPKVTTAFAAAWHLSGFAARRLYRTCTVCRAGVCLFVRAKVAKGLLGMGPSVAVESSREARGYVLNVITRVCLGCLDGLAGLVAGLIDSEGSVDKSSRLVVIGMKDAELLARVASAVARATGAHVECRVNRRGITRITLDGGLPGWFWRRVLRYVAHPARRLRLMRFLVDDSRSMVYRRLLHYVQGLAEMVDTSICVSGTGECREVVEAVVGIVERLVGSRASRGPRADEPAPAPPLLLVVFCWASVPHAYGLVAVTG